MNFKSKQDINAPAEHVFNQLADFDFYESYAMRLGAQVERMGYYSEPQPGMCWNIKGHIRGKERDIELTLDTYRPIETLSYVCTSNALNAMISFNTIPLSKTETRMKIAVNIRARSLSARIALQSAKLAKKTLNRKFHARMHDFANRIGEKYRG
jgi:hypothetical protein